MGVADDQAEDEKEDLRESDGVGGAIVDDGVVVSAADIATMNLYRWRWKRWPAVCRESNGFSESRLHISSPADNRSVDNFSLASLEASKHTEGTNRVPCSRNGWFPLW